MAPIEDHGYIKLCAELASCMSISLASARRKVELAATRKGVKDLITKKTIVEDMLKVARTLPNSEEQTLPAQFDQLLEALAEEENFMLED